MDTDINFSYFNPPIGNSNPNKTVCVVEIYKEIKSDKNKLNIEKIRSILNKNERRKLKSKILPYVSFGGVFTYRDKKNLSESSGLACFDIDELKEEKLVNQIKLWQKNQFTHLLFKSPSGIGLKLIVKIPKVKNDYGYKEYFEGFLKYLKSYGDISENTDDSCKDICRACFLSYDPEAYYNPDSKIWEEKGKVVEEIKGEIVSTTAPEYCGFMENVACKMPLKTINAAVTRHAYIDGNAYQYLKDKPKLFLAYKKIQNREDSAFNDCNDWKFNCNVITKYIRENGIEEGIKECLKCPLFKEVVDFENVKKDVVDFLIEKKTHNATERIVKYIKERNYIYTTRHDEKEEVWIYDNGIYTPNGKTFIKEITRKILDKAYTTYLGNEVINKIEADSYVNADKFFQTNYIHNIAIENGILNIFNGKIEDFTPKKIFFNKLPVVYDTTKKCPNIIKHFEAVLNDKEDIPLIQELFGFLLLKEYKFEKAFMFLGSGRNGKSKTVELMKRFLGIENCVNISLQQLEPKTDNFAMGELVNKLANLGADISNQTLIETGNFKALTGRDLISAARKFLSRINFINYAKMIFCANEIPKTYDTSIAFFERWILLDFPYTFLPKKEYDLLEEKALENIKIADVDIIEKITTKEEMSGLLNWALEGLKRLVKDNGFSYSHTMEEVKKIWIRKSNSLSAFLMDCTNEDYNGKITKADLRKIYNHYCKKFKLKPISDKLIKNTLNIEMGVVDDRFREGGVQIPYWNGISFKNNDVFGKGGMDGNGFSTLWEVGYFPKGETPIPSIPPLPNENQDEKVIEEEFIVDERELIHTECFYCDKIPCVKFNRIGKPTCANCLKDPNIEENKQ